MTDAAARRTVTSADGTTLAYERHGRGPALVMVDGAMCTRRVGRKPELVEALARHFTVVIFDRRGRGESGDRPPYAVDREIEDIGTMIDVAGGTAVVWGHSSGAALALLAAVALGDQVRGLAIYEAPYSDDPERQSAWRAYLAEMGAALADERPGDAVAAFMTLVGMPAEQVAGMRQSPQWAGMAAVGLTLAYDHLAIMGPTGAVPVGLAAKVAVPTIVLYGEASFPFMADTARTLAGAIPGASLVGLAGQGHEPDSAVVAPVLVEHFAA